MTLARCARWLLTTVLLVGSVLQADMVTRRWGVPKALQGGATASAPAKDQAARRPVQVIPCEGTEGIARFDLADLPKGAKIIRADLVVSRSVELTGKDSEAMTAIAIYPLLDAVRTDKPPGVDEKSRLALRGPWFDRFDAAEAVRQWAVGKANGGFLVKACPKWDAEATYLDVAYEGKADKGPPQVTDLKVLHRAGQTFVTWREIENPLGDKPPTLGALRQALEEMESARQVRYRVYRHGQPIDKTTIAEAELLAEVKPLSGYNVGGVSPDHVIQQRQLRALDDGLYARSIAPDPFSVTPKAKEMGGVAVRRLAVEEGKPLPAGAGLYVHQPDKAGQAYYAVVTCIDGLANTTELSPACSLAGPLAEQVGAGEPVFQNTEDLKVFYDYPGERRHYVQWCAPPLANLPNQAHNWSVYVPPAAGGKDPLALAVYFHEWRYLYLRPRWPHLPDQIMIATCDAPWASFGYGYHEALGTLKSFAEGTVHEYTAARIDAFVEWVGKKFTIDANRVSCHGMDTLAGTAALHYGLRRPEKIALIITGIFDADPKSTPAMVRWGGQRMIRSHLPEMETVWGKKEWDLKTDKGVSIWKDRDLPEFVLKNEQVALPYISIGAGSSHLTWPQEVAFMTALLKARQPFMAEFYWGSTPPRYGFNHIRRDRLTVAVDPGKTKVMESEQWVKGTVGYSGGGEVDSGVSWNGDTVVDTPERLEVEGNFGGAVTFRNVQQFKLKPGEKVKWALKTGQREEPAGEAAADDKGLLTIPGMSRGRIVVTRVGS